MAKYWYRLDPSIDLALRAGEVHDDRLVAHAIGTFRRIAVASPRYLAEHPVRRIADLSQRSCLIFSATDITADWTFARGDLTEEVTVQAALSARSFFSLLHAARAGLGVARIPEFVAAEWIKRGDVVRVLPGWASAPVTVFAVHRFGHERIARVGALLRVIREQTWLG